MSEAAGPGGRESSQHVLPQARHSSFQLALPQTGVIEVCLHDDRTVDILAPHDQAGRDAPLADIVHSAVDRYWIVTGQFGIS
jgi:hypothetical protein